MVETKLNPEHGSMAERLAKRELNSGSSADAGGRNELRPTHTVKNKRDRIITNIHDHAAEHGSRGNSGGERGEGQV
jgi:hypothetical protein